MKQTNSRQKYIKRTFILLCWVTLRNFYDRVYLHTERNSSTQWCMSRSSTSLHFKEREIRFFLDDPLVLINLIIDFKDTFFLLKVPQKFNCVILQRKFSSKMHLSFLLSSKDD